MIVLFDRHTVNTFKLYCDRSGQGLSSSFASTNESGSKMLTGWCSPSRSLVGKGSLCRFSFDCGYNLLFKWRGLVLCVVVYFGAVYEGGLFLSVNLQQCFLTSNIDECHGMEWL